MPQYEGKEVTIYGVSPDGKYAYVSMERLEQRYWWMIHHWVII